MAQVEPEREPPHEADEAWFRAHFAGKVLAEVRWLGNQYEIRVVRMPGRSEVTAACCTEKFPFAKTRADRLVRDAYPHTCEKSECAPWMRYAQSGREA